MSEITFIQVQRDNQHHCEIFKRLMLPYNREIGAKKPDGTPYSDEFLEKWTQSCIDMQGPHDRHMELAYIGDEPIGFLYGKVDHEGHKGFIKPEYGYIMEFYIIPENRRRGYGKVMFQRLEQHFFAHGIKRMYLTTGTSGESFWRAMGFIPTGEVSPENNMQIYEKDVDTLYAIPMQNEHIDFVIAIMTSDNNKTALHLSDRSIQEWRDGFTRNLIDLDEANFIFHQGLTPVAWLKIHGMLSKNNRAAISMLVVHEDYQRQGIGNFAVRFAEDYIASKGFTGMSIHTTIDNSAAINCYKRLGYTIFKVTECTVDDGVKRQGVTFYRDHLDAIRTNIDGVPFHIGKPHDFSFLSKLGKVFRVFDAMDSGNICFGIERDDKRFFVKYAGARTQNYDGEIIDAITRLKNAVKLYEDLHHPHLIRLIEHYPVGDGYVAVFDWVNGEGLRSYWDYVLQAMWNHPASPNYRFRRLPIENRIAAVDKILEFHRHVIQHGYVPVDFYDGSLLYDFGTDGLHICDIDFYRKMPAVNDMGQMWGSERFMSPEEYERGAPLDEIKTVHNMGTTMFELLCVASKDSYDVIHSYEAWSASKALFDVAKKAVSPNRCERYQTISELIAAWDSAKVVDHIEYCRLSLEDVKPDMFKYFNRYQEVKKKWETKNGEWVLVNSPHTLNWDEATKQKVATKYCKESIFSGGCLWGAFDDEKLIGFCAISSKPIGSKEQYMQLSQIHVSYEYRGKGIGRKLFSLSAEEMKNCTAKKFYIVANPSEESQAFYRAMGCVDAEEIISELFDDEYDIHMEYVL